jgi:dUTP pyrophosphatase
MRPDAVLPAYAHGPHEDAGMDLCAVEDVSLEPGVPRMVPTGLTVEIPPGYEGQVRPRSGLALKHAITMPNAPGTIDPGYRGELRVILLNLGREAYTVRAGDRIAQMIVARYEAVEWVEGGLADSVRGTGGFGSSGR